MSKELLVSKRIDVLKLNEGDKIKLTNGDEMIFIRVKKTNFIATMNGSSYNVPISMFDKVMEEVDLKSKNDQKLNVLSDLKKGDWFYINKNGRAVCFKFEKIENGKIIGIEPISGSRTRIDISFDIAKIEMSN